MSMHYLLSKECTTFSFDRRGRQASAASATTECKTMAHSWHHIPFGCLRHIIKTRSATKKKLKKKKLGKNIVCAQNVYEQATLFKRVEHWHHSLKWVQLERSGRKWKRGIQCSASYSSAAVLGNDGVKYWRRAMEIFRFEHFFCPALCTSHGKKLCVLPLLTIFWKTVAPSLESIFISSCAFFLLSLSLLPDLEGKKGHFGVLYHRKM